MKREKPKRPRTLRTIVLSLLRAETYDLGNGQRGSDVARNDSMMEPFFPKCKGALLFHTFARSSSLSILLHGLGQGMACVCMRLGRETGRERERAGALCTILLGVHLMLCFPPKFVVPS